MRRFLRGILPGQKGKAKFIDGALHFKESSKPVVLDIEETPFADVYIDGEKQTGEVTVTESNKFKIEYKENVRREPSVRLESFVTRRPNRELSVKKMLVPGYNFIFKPIKEYSEILKLRIYETEFQQPVMEVEEIENFLKKEGIKGEWIEENIKELAESQKEIELPIARSRDPVPGKPDRFELVEGLKDEGEVEKDQLIARYVSETPGVDGEDIYGNVIESTLSMYFPDMGPGIMVEDEGIKGVKSGRLVFTKSVIDVIERAAIQRDFSWEDGLVEYGGDVVIDGDLKEGAQIKASGNVIIRGRVSESNVFADGHINIEGNVDESVVYAGFSKYSAQNLENYCLQCLVIIEQLMFEASLYGEGTSDYSGLTERIEATKEKYRSIKESVNPITSVIDQYGDEEVKDLYKNLDTVFEKAEEKALYGSFKEEEMKEAMDLFYELIEQAKVMFRDHLGTLTINSSNRSHLYAYRNINVIGSGTFQTNLESFNQIDIRGKSIVSNLTAKHKVEVQEFSPGNELDCYIRVSDSRGEIKAEKIL